MSTPTKPLARLLGAVLCASLLSACSSAPKSVLDKDKLSGIKTAALVGFSLPTVVGPDGANSGQLSGALMLATAIINKAKGESFVPENGGKAADEIIPGFMERAATHKGISWLPKQQVSGNAEYQALVAKLSDSKKDPNRVSAPGLALMSLPLAGEASAALQQAAKSLNVDGVLVVQLDQVSHQVVNGTPSLGQARAFGNGRMALFDRNGGLVWSTQMGVASTNSAGMVGGAVTPAQQTGLHETLGAELAARMLRDWGVTSP
jgi:hypothetical protein